MINKRNKQHQHDRVTQDHKQTRPIASIIPDIYKTCCHCLSVCLYLYYNFNTLFSCVNTQFVCFSMSRLSVVLGSC